MIIAQISDLHVRPRGRTAYGDVDTNAMLERAVAAIRALTRVPDCVVVTGDLTDCGLDEEYAELCEILAPLPMPVFVIPGNHDRREALVAALGGRHDYLPRDGAFLQYAIDSFPVRLIALDSVIPGQTHGELCAARLAWLERCLAERQDSPTILFIHHPPFPTGIQAMDALGCRAGGDALATIVRRHPQIERVVAGHFHRPITVRWAGTIGYAAPSTAHQVALDLRQDEPTRFVLEPPGFAVHTWRQDTGVVSHAVPIGDHGPWFDVTLEAEYPGRA
jgi:3',5'-cyclic AMP phosphodiesterase CpdA